MAQNETWLNHDMMNAVKVQYLDGNVFSMDNAGNLIGVHLTRGGVDYDGVGSVSANVIRADGTTVAVPGTLYAPYASVVLPQAAYAVPGIISIIIKLTVDGAVTTIGAMVANVYVSTTDTVVDPGTIIPSISSLIASIEEAVDTIPLDYSALSNGFRDAMEAEFGLTVPASWSSYTIRKSNGTATASSVYKITPQMPITGNVILYTTSPATDETVLAERASIAFYSTNSATGYISSVDIQEGDPQTIVWQASKVPANARYMRIMIGNTLTDQFKCIQIGSVDTYRHHCQALARISSRKLGH